MKKNFSFMVVALCLMVFAMFPMVASAHINQTLNTETAPIITKDNAQAILEAAQQGDENAIEVINNLDCFNSEKVQQKGTLMVSSEEGSKEYFFDDGSSITMSVGREVNPSAYYYVDHGLHQWKLAGVEIARYVIYHKIQVASDFRHGWSIEHWDDGEGLPGVYNVTEYGTRLHSGKNYDVSWRIRGATKYVQTLTGVSSPKYNFEFYDDVAGNSQTLKVL